jgi:hypothetical protein
MRLLAVTAGPDAQGRITEAEQVVGRISLDGTLGFIFTGLFIGAVSEAACLLVRRWLPAGRVGGVAFGVLLLVLAGTRVEPLRPGNLDFDLVGPGWVSVAAFAAWRDRRSVTAGRVVLALVALAALPGFASAVVDILGRR